MHHEASEGDEVQAGERRRQALVVPGEPPEARRLHTPKLRASNRMT
jgi:hypothetical protein